jgi:ubiquinone/menaquinone biosynthesis C-methylase UbiE
MGHNFFDNPLKSPENISKKNIIEREFYNKEAENSFSSFEENNIKKIISEYEEDYTKSRQQKILYDRYHYFFKIIGNVENKKILELGSGYGYMSAFFAKLGAEVITVDISEKMLQFGRKVSRLYELDKRVIPVSTSAEFLSFRNDVFDIVICFASLHHFQFDSSLKEIHRVLKKGGHACFIDPLANSKFLYNLRQLIPLKNYESPGGGGIKYSDIKKLPGYFETVHYKEFELFSRLSRIIRSAGFLSALRKFDYKILEKFKFLRKYARGIVIKVSK